MNEHTLNMCCTEHVLLSSDAEVEDCHRLCTTCAPFDTLPERNKAYNIFCERLMEKLDADGSTMRKEFVEKHPNHELEDILMFATRKWRALLLKHSKCLALLDRTAHGAYETYPIDLPEWVRRG